MSTPEDVEPRRRDATATTARLLAAARSEFAEHGLAGGRIDRIAEAAEANKRLLYVYLGNKQEVFAAVVTECVTELNAAVPFDPTDLAEYAGRVHDFLTEHTEVLRILSWRDVEGAVATGLETASYADRVEIVAAAQADGIIAAGIEPIDLIAIVESIIESWLTATVGLLSIGGVDRDRLDANRRGVVEAVRRIASPS